MKAVNPVESFQWRVSLELVTYIVLWRCQLSGRFIYKKETQLLLHVLWSADRSRVGHKAHVSQQTV